MERIDCKKAFLRRGSIWYRHVLRAKTDKNVSNIRKQFMMYFSVFSLLSSDDIKICKVGNTELLIQFDSIFTIQMSNTVSYSCKHQVLKKTEFEPLSANKSTLAARKQLIL